MRTRFGLDPNPNAQNAFDTSNHFDTSLSGSPADAAAANAALTAPAGSIADRADPNRYGSVASRTNPGQYGPNFIANPASVQRQVSPTVARPLSPHSLQQPQYGLLPYLQQALSGLFASPAQQRAGIPGALGSTGLQTGLPSYNGQQDEDGVDDNGV